MSDDGVANTENTESPRLTRQQLHLQKLKKHQFSSTNQPKTRGRCGPAGAKLYRWALDLPAPEAKLAELRLRYPGIGTKKKLTMDDVRRISVVELAIDGDIPANKEIDDRLYGKAQAYIDHTTKGESIDRERDLAIDNLAAAADALDRIDTAPDGL